MEKEEIKEEIKEELRQEIKQEEREEKEKLSRRSFLKKLGAGAIGLGALSMAPAASKIKITDSGIQKNGNTYDSIFLGETEPVANSPLTYSSGTFDLSTGTEFTTDGSGNLSMNVVTSGQVTLSSGTATIDTAISATDATFMLSMGIDDPNADAKVTGRLFWDDSAGTYKIEFVEDGTSIGNPTVNYDVVRVR